MCSYISYNKKLDVWTYIFNLKTFVYIEQFDGNVEISIKTEIFNAKSFWQQNPQNNLFMIHSQIRDGERFLYDFLVILNASAVCA